MRRLTDNGHAADLSSRAVKAGATTRWKLVLVSAPDDDPAALQYRLSPVELSDRGVELRGNTSKILDENENGRVVDPVFRVCNPLFFTSGASTDHITLGFRHHLGRPPWPSSEPR